MDTYKVQKRDLGIKAKRLRREGFVTGNLFGREIENSIPLIFEKKDAERLVGSGKKQVVLDLEGKKYNVILKTMDFNTLKRQILELDFQVLEKGEIIHSKAEVVLIGKDMVKEGVLEQLVSEIPYKAKAENLVDTVEVDCSKLRVGDRILVSDLALAKDPDIELAIKEDRIIVEVLLPKTAAPEEGTEEAAEGTAE